MNINKKITPYNRNIMNNKQNKYIVIHYTANNGDTAKNNADYFYNELPPENRASAHYFVDEREIWQVVEDKDRAWHCDTKKKYYHDYCRNNNSIGIEMCTRIEKSTGKYYIKDKVILNTIELTKKLMKKYNIPIENVIRHYDVTHKRCPAPMVDNIDLWNSFKERLKDKEEEDMPRYNTLEELPDYAQSTIKKLIDKKILNGDGTGLNLSEDMIRILVINDRSGLYDK